MQRLYITAACLAACALSPQLVARADGQTTAVPTHKHYDKPAGYDQAVAPGMPVAPRLQNLGVHTFTVTTKSDRAQLFINQGMNLAYGFNHAEAVRAFSEAARLDPECRDGVLGPRARPRTEHQRDDERGGRAEGTRPGAESRRAEGESDAARARVHRRARRTATPARPRTGRKPTGPSPTRCARW